MKVALIGNGFDDRPYQHPSELDLDANPSRIIDACEVVARCNRCPHYWDGWTGWKTDILFARSAAGIHGRRMVSQYDFSIPSDVICGINQFVVVGDTPADRPAIGLRPYLDRYPELQHVIYEFLPFEWHDPLTRQRIGLEGKIPTLGAIALVYLMTAFPDAAVLLSGFTFVDAHLDYHNWQAEQNWIAKHPKIQIL